MKKKQIMTIEKFKAWRVRHIPDGIFLVVLAAVIGTAAGFGAFVLKFTIGHVGGFLTHTFRTSGPNWWLLILPLVGILIAVIYQRYVVGYSLMHGVELLDRDLRRKHYYLPAGITYSPIIASTFTLGFGGSAGAEGPIAYAGAAIGSNLARITGLPPHMVRIMIGCGAGAGIAGIFKAPMGGALFTLEVMGMSLTTLSVMALIVACICGGLMCFVCTGFTPDVNFMAPHEFIPSTVPWIVLLGVFCGIYSTYYSWVMNKMVRWFKTFRNPWLLATTGGVIMGVLLFLFPVLYGEGYGVVTQVVNGDFSHLLEGSVLASFGSDTTVMLIAVACIMLVKSAAVASSNSTGGVAGDFAPTIFAGAMTGLLFTTVANEALGAGLPVGHFALLATAGIFAGTIHAPVMAIFLCSEMSNGYPLLLGFAICSTVSYLTMKMLTPRTTYRQALSDDIHKLLHLRRPKSR